MKHKKNTLWAYGCSWTAGESLKDNTIKISKKEYQPIHKPSRYAYPKILARLLRMICENRAYAGQGNDAILYNIIDDYDSWNDGDVIVIMWTGPTRKVFFEKYPGTNLLHQSKSKWYQEYLKNDCKTNWFDSRFKSGYNRLIVEKLANSKNVLLIQSETDFASLQNEIKYDIIDERFDRNIKHFLPCPIENDYGALDNAHPGPMWHANVATYFYNYIKTLKYNKAKE